MKIDRNFGRGIMIDNFLMNLPDSSILKKNPNIYYIYNVFQINSHYIHYNMHPTRI